MRDEGILAVDLDGTVVRCNTFPRYVRFQVAEGVRRKDVRLVARLAAAVLLRRLRLIGHRALKAEVVRQSGRVDGESCRAWARELLRTHGNPEVVQRVAAWEGPKVLASAAPEACARAFAELLSLDGCVGSVLAAGGLVDNEGEAKVDRLAAAGYRHITVAITDDARADAPLLAAAREGYLVDAHGAVSSLRRPEPAR
ncbi:MAG: haloacid dehalogenase-like hydrolase [Acidimicrobiales bacterium]